MKLGTIFMFDFILVQYITPPIICCWGEGGGWDGEGEWGSDIPPPDLHKEK